MQGAVEDGDRVAGEVDPVAVDVADQACAVGGLQAGEAVASQAVRRAGASAVWALLVTSRHHPTRRLRAIGGFVIVGLYIVTWAVALSIWYFGKIEQKWDLAARASASD